MAAKYPHPLHLFPKTSLWVVTLGVAAVGPRALILTRILFLTSSSPLVFRRRLSLSFVPCKRSSGKDQLDLTGCIFILSHSLSLEIYNTIRNPEMHRCGAILLIQNVWEYWSSWIAQKTLPKWCTDGDTFSFSFHVLPSSLLDCLVSWVCNLFLFMGTFPPRVWHMLYT